MIIANHHFFNDYKPSFFQTIIFLKHNFHQPRPAAVPMGGAAVQGPGQPGDHAPLLERRLRGDRQQRGHRQRFGHSMAVSVGPGGPGV